MSNTWRHARNLEARHVVNIVRDIVGARNVVIVVVGKLLVDDLVDVSVYIEAVVSRDRLLKIRSFKALVFTKFIEIEYYHILTDSITRPLQGAYTGVS